MAPARRGGAFLLAIGPSSRFTLANLAAVAAGPAQVDLDASALESLPVPKGPAGGAVEDAASVGNALSAVESRAVLVARLVALLRGRQDEKRKSVDFPYLRREVPEFIAQVLNKGLAPVLHAGSAGSELAALVKSGAGQLHGPSGPVEASAVLSEHGIKPVTWITQGEVDVIKSGTFGVTGPAALEAYAAGSLSNVVDAVAAVTCEAFKAFTDPLDPKNLDPHRPHRGQITSATNLRLCLEGSSLVNKRADAKSPDPDAIRCIPQLHGPAHDDLESGLKAIERELNSAESDQLQSKPTALGPLHPAQVVLNRQAVQRSLALLEEASLGRITALTGEQQAAAEGPTTPDRLTQTLAAELSIALNRLKEFGDAIAAANEKKQQKQPPQTPGAEDGEADGSPLKSPTAGGAAKPDAAPMDPEKAAKLEAKRREKAEKAAAKAAAKAAKKEKGLVLGVGSTQLRDRLLSALDGNGIDQQLLAQALDPFLVSNDSLSSFCLALYEKLSSGGAQRKPKIAKGVRDFGPFVKKDFDDDMLVREEAFSIIRSIFKRHGAKEIDTPVFELRETLKGKYGEDSKLIYDLADQGGELLSLRYDLTVPFARYLAMYNPGNFKRYHIAKVYRRDNPAMNRGRFREFYQCDFDIAGTYPTMVPDAEVITVASEILSSLPIGPFMIKLNHRRLLDSIFEIAGVPAEKFRTICSAVDKLDKEPWEAVKREMTEEKGLSPEVADRIGSFVQHRGEPRQLHQKLLAEGLFGDHAGAGEAMSELAVLFSYLEALDALQYVSFDLSLARGLDYYTGVIYEAVITAEGCQVGSIAAGGRYDRLVGMFSASGQQTPCVGVSIGIERVLTLMEEKVKAQRAGQRVAGDVEVLVATIGADRLPLRMKLAKSLWRAGIPAEYMAQDNLKLTKQMDYASDKNIPFLVIAGGDESRDGLLRVKLSKNFADYIKPGSAAAEQEAQEGNDDTLTRKGALVKEDEVVPFLLSQGVRVVKWESRMTGAKAAWAAENGGSA